MTGAGVDLASFGGSNHSATGTESGALAHRPLDAVWYARTTITGPTMFVPSFIATWVVEIVWTVKAANTAGHYEYWYYPWNIPVVHP